MKDLTNNILNKKNNIINKEIKKIYNFEKKIELLSKKRLSPIQKIYFLIDDCKKYGTLPFSGLARIAFIYTKLIKTLVQEKILSQQDIENFYETCETITSDMNNHLYKIRKNKDKKKKFLQKFGHLRPSTYSINSKNYKKNFSKYFSNVSLTKPKKVKKFKLTNNQNYKIDKILTSHGLISNSKNFFAEARKSIQLRNIQNLFFQSLLMKYL